MESKGNEDIKAEMSDTLWLDKNKPTEEILLKPNTLPRKCSFDFLGEIKPESYSKELLANISVFKEIKSQFTPRKLKMLVANDD